jgi:hypothetical protein
MKLHEEFKLYENMWDDLSNTAEDRRKRKQRNRLLKQMDRATAKSSLLIEVPSTNKRSEIECAPHATVLKRLITFITALSPEEKLDLYFHWGMYDDKFDDCQGDPILNKDSGDMYVYDNTATTPVPSDSHDKVVAALNNGVDDLKESLSVGRDWFEENVSLNGAVYAARELTYHFVKDPEDAEALMAKAEAEEWEYAEVQGLSDLIGDALTASNYHTEAGDYSHSNHEFPYWWSFDATDEECEKVDALIATCTNDDDRFLLLNFAINDVALEVDFLHQNLS